MPNHSVNRIVFDHVSDADHKRILASVSGPEGPVDFSVLLPIPLNYWQGSVGMDEEKAFPGDALTWCSANWGTKWNAYGDPRIERDGDQTVLIFTTAWSTPRGWLCALFNAIQLPFTVTWSDEYDDAVWVEEFRPTPESAFTSNRWSKRKATDEEKMTFVGGTAEEA